jgi:hypothetical protein
MYLRCICDLDGKIRGKKCQRCDGWGVTLEQLPPRPAHLRPEQKELPLVIEQREEQSA